MAQTAIKTDKRLIRQKNELYMVFALLTEQSNYFAIAVWKAKVEKQAIAIRVELSYT